MANQEVADYSIRVAKMFSYFLEHGTATDAKVMKHSIRYLDQNRFLSWEDYLSIFKGLSKIVSLYPNENWSEIEKALRLEKIDNVSLLKETIEDWKDPNLIKQTIKFKNNKRLNCIYNKIKSIGGFQKILSKFDSKFSTVNLIFDVGELRDEVLAQTELNNKTITIIFNPKHIDTQSNLSIADSFIHEALHAEIYRILNEKYHKDEKELEKYLKKRTYYKLWDYYSKYKEGDGYHHRYMADIKFEVMTSFLSEFDKSLTAEELKAYVWESFYGTAPWNELTKEERNNYITTVHEIEKKSSKECN